MMADDRLNCVFFELITHFGKARSCFIQAVSKAKEMKYSEVNELWAEGISAYSVGQKIHNQLIQEEVTGVKIDVTLLQIHAEDILMSAETLKILCEEFLLVYKEINLLKSYHKLF